jgi:hypothetical protein
MALPKLEVVNEEVRGTFAAAKIEHVSFREVEDIDRYHMTGITAKGRATGIKPLVQDCKKVRLEAKSLMARLCGKKKAVVESDLLYLEHFTTRSGVNESGLPTCVDKRRGPGCDLPGPLFSCIVLISSLCGILPNRPPTTTRRPCCRSCRRS